jgi:hypothetical protein
MGEGAAPSLNQDSYPRRHDSHTSPLTPRSYPAEARAAGGRVRIHLSRHADSGVRSRAAAVERPHSSPHAAGARFQRSLLLSFRSRRLAAHLLRLRNAEGLTPFILRSKEPQPETASTKLRTMVIASKT